jgi:L-proline amide hydrolase
LFSLLNTVSYANILASRMLQVTTGSFSSHKHINVHYWRYASANLDKDKFPVVVVNGGPGLSHDYNLPLRQLACRGREVIFYDQGGTGKSALAPNTTVANDYPFLLNATYYSQEELPALVKALALKKYHIVSDSWGTMVAMQSVIHKRDPNLLSLTLNGPIPKSSEYIEKAWDPVEGSIGTLPYYIKRRMLAIQKRIQKSRHVELEEVQEIQMTIMNNFHSRNGLAPDCASKSFSQSNVQVADGMWAPVDTLFSNATGTLRDFDLWPDIKNEALNDVPTLLTSGRFDMVRPVTVNALFKQLPLSERVLFPYAGHDTIFDATEELLNTVASFLTRVEFAETDEQEVFVPKRPGEEKASFPAAALQFVVAALIVFVSFILGIVVGQSRASKFDRSQYSEIA